ncbi:MAG TPA: hypothetical protein VGB27_12200, partial [Candidatus Binatia bacterium]
MMPNYRGRPQGRRAAEVTAGSWETANPVSPSVMESEAGRGERSNDNSDFSPCVIFEAKPSLEIISVSKSVTDLLGLNNEA